MATGTQVGLRCFVGLDPPDVAVGGGGVVGHLVTQPKIAHRTSAVATASAAPTNTMSHGER